MLMRSKLSRLCRGGRKTWNPWTEVTIEYDRYGKYANLFDSKTHSKKYYDNRDKTKYVIPMYGLQDHPFFGLASFVAPGVICSGNVEIWHFSTIWYGCTIRADTNLVRIGAYATIHENCVITEATSPIKNEVDHDGSTIVGHYSTIGYGSTLEACTVESHCVVGPGCVLTPNSYIEEYGQLEAGSVLYGRVPCGEVWGGNPAKYIRDVDTLEKIQIYNYACQNNLAEVHRDEFYLPSMLHVKAEEADYKDLIWGKPGWKIIQENIHYFRDW